MAFVVKTAAFILALILPNCLALPTPYLAAHRRGVHAQATAVQAPQEGLPPTQWFTAQRVDHFDGANPATFAQRYWVNDTFWKAGPDGSADTAVAARSVAFLCVGGEGPPLDASVVVKSIHCNDAVELAPKLGALIVALEHRYYGESVPTEDLSTRNLRYLSSHQALADLANFRVHVAAQYAAPEGSTKWVSFGGSYPGMLSGWLRLKYPHLFHASVSSSSPVRAKLDMQCYNNIVGASMAAPIVGGSAACAAAIKAGHETVGTLLKTTAGQQQLQKAFNVCGSNGKGGATGLADAGSQSVFAGMGVVGFPAQENDPSCTYPACNIAKVCTIMTNETLGTPLERLVEVNNQQGGGANAPCRDVDFDANIIAPLLNVTKEGGTARIWTYQTCAEFAFYQTCEIGSGCLYTQGLVTLPWYTDQCEKAFGISPATVAANVNSSNAEYGSDNPGSSRVFFPNGQIDPWHGLGVLTAPTHSYPAGSDPVLMVAGASHHFWTHPSKPTDTAAIVAARETEWKQVEAWLAESP